MKSNNIEELITKVSELPTISKKSAEKITFKLIENINTNKDVLLDISNTLAKITIDELSGQLYFSDETKILSNEILYLFETNKEAYNIFAKLGFDNMAFIINFSQRSDYLNFEKVKLLLERFFQFLKTIEITEIVLMLSPRPETEVFFQMLKQKLKTSEYNHLKITKLATGIPFNGSVEYLDEFTIKGAMKNRGEK